MSAVRILALAASLAGAALAHVGSPDVFFRGSAGPYPLLISVRPPDVIPGVARVQVRALSGGVRKVNLTPTPMTGPAAQHPPVADEATSAQGDPKLFEGALWLMTAGSWEVHIGIAGDAGPAELPVPVPAVALKMRPMDRGTEYFLLGMLVFLTSGMVAIVGAAVRDAQLEPGLPSRSNRRSVTAMATTAVILGIVLWSGWRWWGSDATANSQKIYKPLTASATVTGGTRLDLRIQDPGWLALRKLDDLVPDHGHMMHLFLIRWPDMGEVFHVHPEQAATGYFTTSAPPLKAGTYRIFADIVHDSGLAETATGTATLPNTAGVPLSGDDAGGSMTTDGRLADGYRMVWNNERDLKITPNQVNIYSFSILDPAGKPVADLEPYMGMGGHAEFVKEDGTVFAHVHPSGSISMASMAVASADAMRAMHQSAIGSEVSFPYGVPSPGNYRLFIQMKRAGKVETGAFRFHVG